jgi:hypothetical protein
MSGIAIISGGLGSGFIVLFVVVFSVLDKMLRCRISSEGTGLAVSGKKGSGEELLNTRMFVKALFLSSSHVDNQSTARQ